LANWLRGLRDQLSDLQMDADDRLEALTGNADQLAQQVASLNEQIIQAEGGAGGQANGLRDQRDAVLKQLAQLVNIKTVQQPNGVVDVYVGSQPLVAATDARGLGLRQETIDGKLTASVIVRADDGQVDATSGQIGGILGARAQIDNVIDQVDELAHHLIFELNKLHASGQGLSGFAAVAATNIADDPAQVLNDPASGLKFAAGNGSFVVHVRQKDTGLVTSTLVQVDLDGLGGDDTTLDSLSAELGAIAGIASSVVAGQLRLSSASSNLEFSFSQDSSGVLAALGINTFFTGSTARDIGVNQMVIDQPGMLAAAGNGDSSDNQTALAIAELESLPVAGLNGMSLKAHYESMVNGVAVSAATAKTNATATQTVQDTLFAQREALSGVSLDEEAINLIRQQRAFQAAARLVSVIDELMRTVLQLT
jgi:flagellar hook-associated protein 1 FlgK